MSKKNIEKRIFYICKEKKTLKFFNLAISVLDDKKKKEEKIMIENLR